MNETSRMYDNQIKKLLDLMDRYMVEQDAIALEIKEKSDIYNAGNFVDYKEFTSRQSKMEIFNQKIKECASSISMLADKIEYETSDFVDSANKVLYRAEVSSYNLPKTGKIGVNITGTVTMENVGFRDWTKVASYLNVRVVNESANVDHTYVFNLTDADQIKTGEKKVFAITIPAQSEDGEYDISVFMAKTGYAFDRIYEDVIYITL